MLAVLRVLVTGTDPPSSRTPSPPPGGARIDVRHSGPARESMLESFTVDNLAPGSSASSGCARDGLHILAAMRVCVASDVYTRHQVT